jgi:hypothetical protein
MDPLQRGREEGWLLLFREAIPSASSVLGYVLSAAGTKLAPRLEEMRRRNVVLVPFSLDESPAGGEDPEGCRRVLDRVLARAWTQCGNRRVVTLGVGGLVRGVDFMKGASAHRTDFWGALCTGEGGVLWIPSDGMAPVGSERWAEADAALRTLLARFGGAAEPAQRLRRG